MQENIFVIEELSNGEALKINSWGYKELKIEELYDGEVKGLSNGESITISSL